MIVHRKPVEAYGADGRLIGKWPSIIQAAMENDGIPGFSKQIIKNCSSCKQRDCEICAYFRKYKRTWRYQEEYGKLEINIGL